jgi:hypothetical protein
VLVLLVGVQVEEGADGLGPAQRLDLRPALGELAGLDREIAPAAVRGEQLEHLLATRAVLLAGRDQLRDEVGLRGDRDLGMGVEHQPQQRRPRAGRPDDERGRRRSRGAAAERAAAAPPAGDRAEDLAAGLHRSSPANSSA